MTAYTGPALGDADRLAILRGLALVDAPEDIVFGRIVRLAATLLGAPSALIALVDIDRQYIAAQVGLDEPWATARQMPISHSFCQYVVTTRAPLVVSDTRLHPLLRGNPATTELSVLAYAGMPLFAADGQPLGALCATDRHPREWSVRDLAILHDLADLVMAQITQRTVVREAWRQAEAQSALLNATGEAIFAIDARGRCTFANPAAAALVGHTREALHGCDLHSLLDPHGINDQPYPKQQWPIFDVIDTGEFVRVAGETIRRADGERVAIDYSAAPIVGAAGPVGAAMTVVDVGDRLRAERDLRHAAESFNSLFEAAGDGLAIHDGTTILAVNKTWAAWLGYTPQELVGRDLFNVLAPSAYAETMWRSRARDTEPYETLLIDREGQTVPMEVVGQAIRFQGRPACLVIGRDRRERQAAEEALRTSEALYRQMFEGNRAIQLVIDPASGAILDANPAACTFYGYSREALLALTIDKLNTLAPDVIAAEMEAAAAEQRSYFLFRHRRASGDIRDVEVHSSPLKWQGRNVLFSIIHDVTERQALEARLAHQAHHDILTGLPNRALFLERLDQSLNRARRGGPVDAVLFLDLDRFKEINDSRGHDVGDRFLIAIAVRLRHQMRAADTLARLGGDEFAILLAGAGHGDEAARVTARLLTALAAPLSLDGQRHAVTASIGVVTVTATYERPEDVLRDADIAMYRAKETGRARYALFDPAMQAALAGRLALEHDLRAALADNQLTLHYQPIIDLVTGRVAKVEALARWRHPTRGMVSPTEFIALAEGAGLIRDLGRWALATACHQAASWARAGYPTPVAVNLTTQEFQWPGLATEVAGALRAAGLEARWLHLEITESLAMRDPAATAATLGALRALGVGVAIDDFGTGYSSLAYLKRLAVDSLKIDKAFIDGLETNPEDTAIVAAIVHLGHTLGLRLVAEGVETAAQVHYLRKLGCDLAQGYYFARPLPGDELTPHLRAAKRPPVQTHALPLETLPPR